MRPLLITAALSIMLAACQRNISTISGRLLGADGNPMPLAHVRLVDATPVPGSLPPLHDPVLITQRVRENGTFAISTQNTGPLALICMGVGHDELFIPLPIENGTDLSLDIRLAREYVDTSRSEIQILSSIDKGATSQGGFLVKQADGSFRTDIPTTADSVEYMIFATGPSSAATTLIGASASRYQIATRNDYVCIVPVVNGHAILDYHAPQQDAGGGGTCQYPDSSSTLATFARLEQKFAVHDASASSSLQNHMRNGKPFSTFKFPWIEYADTLASAIGHTNTKLLKEELALEVLECYQRANVPMRHSNLRRMIIEVPPTSLAWVYHGSLALAIRNMPEMGETYFTSIIDHHPSRSYAAYLLFLECVEAKQAREDATVARLLARLRVEFDGTSGAREAIELYTRRELIQIGSILPDFAFRSVEDSNVVFANSTFHGKHLLMVFWSTWCAPCVAEMPLLHRLHERYGKAGLEILSVAVQNNPAQIASFRRLRWPMPWSVAVVPEEKEASIRSSFPVTAGRHILADPTGKVLMVGSPGVAEVDSTLSSLFENNRPQAR